MWVNVGQDARSRFGIDVRMLRFWNRPGREEPVMLAQDLLAQGRVEEAVKVSAYGLERDPTDAELMMTHGLAWLRAGEPLRAQRWLVRAAGAAPDWIEPFRWLGEVLVYRDQMTRAKAVFERVLALGEQDPDLREKARKVTRLGGIQERLDRFLVQPGCEEPAMLAQDLLTLGRGRDAFGVTRAALAQDAEDADVLLAHARILRACRKLDLAEETLRHMVELDDSWVEPWRDLAELCLERDALREAEHAIERGLDCDPKHRGLNSMWLRVEERIEELGLDVEVEPAAKPVEAAAEPVVEFEIEIEVEAPVVAAVAEPVVQIPTLPVEPATVPVQQVAAVAIVSPTISVHAADTQAELDIALDDLLLWLEDGPLPGADTLPGYPSPLATYGSGLRSPESYQPARLSRPYLPPSPAELGPTLEDTALPS